MATSMESGICVMPQGAVAVVTLNNPGKLNAMSRPMWRDLKVAFLAIQADPGIRCVLVRGAEGHFCAGGDIAEYPDFRFKEAALRHFHEEEVWGGLSAMLACDVPIVAQIEGVCMGAGVEIASACDLRLGADTATFGAPIARLGFPMAPREAALVSAAVGAMTARAMLLAAEVFSASHMAAQGFLIHMLAPAELDTACQALVQRMAGLAPQAARLNKQTLRALQAGTVVDQPYGYADSPEHREGITAFLAKRKPLF
jgi:enoyl-CoA hydratase/carnithine racemase